MSCASPSDTVTNVEWFINETQLEDLNLTNVVTDFSEPTGLGILRFNDISVEYNNTNIQCRANLSDGETEDSNNVILLVQGEREEFIN